MPKTGLHEEYPETHCIGNIFIEKELSPSVFKGDLGIQISKDGRVWICIDGQAVIRFSPRTTEQWSI